MDAQKLHRLAVAATLCGVPRGTLRSGIDRGELPVYHTACGLPLVSLGDVRRWAKVERKPGRKPSATA